MFKLKHMVLCIVLCLTMVITSGAIYAAEPAANSSNGSLPFINEAQEAILDEMLHHQAEQAVAEVIEEANRSNLSLAPSKRPTYETKYGTEQKVSAPFRAADGQPPGGYRFNTGGTVNIETTAGTTFTFSYEFPKPFEKIGIAATPGKSTTKVTGYSVNIPASKTKFYKVYISNIYKCQPFIVYEISSVTGKKSVYHKGSSKIYYATDNKTKVVE